MKPSVFLFSMLLFVLCANAQTKNFIDQPYIEVSGSADTLVTPNEIYIRILLSEKDTRDRTSIEDLEQKMVTVLKGLGLDTEKDLTTSDILSNFQYYFLKSKDVIKTKLYSLKVTNATTASQVFMKLEEAGISNSSIERVDHSNMKDLKNTMRTKAILDAKERALSLTRPLNQKVGMAINIVETDNNTISTLNGRVAGLQIRGVNSLQDTDKLQPKIEFEKIRVTSNVSAKFILN